MGEEILNIQMPVAFDESIEHYEILPHKPYAVSSFDNNDEIRIVIQHQDLCLLPSKSSLHVRGKISKPDGTIAAATTLVNNAICHLFEQVQYKINDTEIDRSKNVGVTSLMKGYASLTPGRNSSLENAGWLEEKQKLTDANGYFDICIPLNMILGFAEDYRKIVVNAKHELILTRSKTDVNAIVQTADEEFKISIDQIEWLVPYVRLSNQHKLRLLNFIEEDPPISMSFRSWELYEYPLLPVNTSKHVWTVKTSTQLEKPRYVILGFQTDRKNKTRKNASHFDHCNISDVKLYLNSQYYPYENLNLDMANNRYALLYGMYANFQATYYGRDPQPLLKKSEFVQFAPLFIIDCSKQNESLKYGPVDIHLEFEAGENFPAGTSAYCLILHDRIVEYNPISGEVKKLV